MIIPFCKYYILALNLLAFSSLFESTKTNNTLTPTKFDSRKYLNSFVEFLVSSFVLYSFQWFDFSNPLLRSFDNLWLSLAYKVTPETYNFVSLIVKIILLASLSPLTSFSVPAPDKT